MRSLISALLLTLSVAALTFVPGAAAAGTFYISGGGNGHGVGMSQYGAYGYALHGAGYPAILAHYYQGTTLQATNPKRLVKVLLGTGSASFSGATRAGSKKLKPSTTYVVQPVSGSSLALVTRSGKRVGTFAAPLTVSGYGPLSLAGMGSYRGALRFLPAGGSVETINVVGVDAYVRGVVTSEMPSSWSAQALDAQAVAARTYALASDVGGSAYQLYTDTRSQAYGGVGAETASGNVAVSATRGQILTYGGAPVITYFFSSSGGYTESVQYAFPGAKAEPWLHGVPDPYDGAGGTDPYHHWSYRMSVASAQAKLAGLVRGSLVGIKVLKHGVSPRIVTAAVIGTGGRTTVSGAVLQQRFGLLSTLARFKTVTTRAGTVVRAVKRAAAGHSPDIALITAETAQGLSALVPRYFAPGAPVITGRLFPGGSLILQKRAGSRWRTLRRAVTASDGHYVLGVPGPGTYRVVAGGLAGPATTVG